MQYAWVFYMKQDKLQSSVEQWGELQSKALGLPLVLSALLISNQNAQPRYQNPHLITLYRDLLVSHSDSWNIERLEFPFHPRWRREELREGQTGGRAQPTQWKKKKRLTTEGLRGNKTSGTLGGGHMSRDGGRGNGKVVDEYLLLKRKRVYRQLRIDWLITFCWNASEVTFSPSLV